MLSGHNVIREVANAGRHAGARRFPGFLSREAVREYSLHPRMAQKLSLSRDDLIRIDTTVHDAAIALLLFSQTGHRLEDEYGFSPLSPLRTELFESAALTGWIEAQGGGGDAHLNAHICQKMNEPLIFKAAQTCTLWICHLVQADELIGGQTDGAVQIQHHSGHGPHRLADPIGRIKDEFTISRGSARAYSLSPGDYVQIVDIEGQQCSDFQAFDTRGLDKGAEHFIDSTATRSMVRSAYPAPGLFDKFYDQHMNPLLRVVQDTCGRHDTFGLACTARSYEERGFPGHLNCSDNISNALSPYGVEARRAWPAINFFWNTWLDEHHQILTEEAFSRAGDYVLMQALEEMVCVSTACPDDIDPINGWNPTDIHIRIYHPEPRIQTAIAYRPKEDAQMHISQKSAFHDRLEPLTNHFAPARDIWSAVSFPASGVLGEYWACRNAATLQDMSGLRKFDIIGPDAGRLLQLAMTRDIEKLAVWRGSYSLLCDESGEVIDDGTLFRLADHLFRWCCGTEESGRWLDSLAEKHQLQVRINDLGSALPNLALQGPKSRDILNKFLFTQPHLPSLSHLKWFGATVGRVGDRNGAPFLLTRTGYTGELGYELFCAPADALEIWDAIMDAGADEGVIPMGSDALEILRIEAGLASRAEFASGCDAYEAGLGFAVDTGKSDFIGRDALLRNQASPRKVLRGLTCKSGDIPRHGAPVFKGERQVGVVTSATRSPFLECSLAMARLTIESAEPGQKLEIGQLDGRMKRLEAEVITLPCYDPKRERARA